MHSRSVVRQRSIGSIIPVFIEPHKGNMNLQKLTSRIKDLYFRFGFRPMGCASHLLLLIAVCAPFGPRAVASQPKPAAGSAAEKKTDGAEASKEKTGSEAKLSPAAAEKLFRSVDEILQFVSKDTGLPIQNSVKRELASRDTVERYMLQHMREDEDSIRLKRAEVVMKKLGLLPQTFDLEPFLLKLMREQVAGFYDSKTRTVYLLDWIETEAQRPVLAHELTHALQDQNYNLEKWSHATPEGKQRENGDVNDLIAVDERNTARGAVLEGQGMVTLLDYMLAPTGRTIAETPQLLEVMKRGMSETETLPFYSNAPVVIKELLGFPYRRGLEFEVEVLKSDGKQGAFKGALDRPPETTHEVMEPQTYIARQKFPPIRLADLPSMLGKGYERYDVGAMGEFDVYVLVKTFAGDGEADKIAKQWRGGLYYAARKSSGPVIASGAMPGSPMVGPVSPVVVPASVAAQASVQAAVQVAVQANPPATSSKPAAAATTGDIALLHEYHFASRDAAQTFADVYGKSLPRKYNSVRRIGEEELRRTENGLAPPLVKPVTAGGYGGAATRTTTAVSGKRGDLELNAARSHVKWVTNEGAVYVDVSSSPDGGTVLIMEGFDQKSASQIRSSVISEGIGSAQNITPAETSAVAMPELGMRIMPLAATLAWQRMALPR